MAKKIVIVISCLVLLLCPLALADVVQTEIDRTIKGNSPSFLYIFQDGGVTDGVADYKTSAYLYGGDYNPLIVVCTDSYKWKHAVVEMYVTFGRTIKAGTTLTIKAKGWRNHSYSVSNDTMYISPISYMDEFSFYDNCSNLKLYGSEDVQTSNGIYYARTFTGTYQLQADADGLWLSYDITLSAARNGGCYLGLSVDSLTCPVDQDSEENAGNKGNGAVDSVMDAINLNTSIYTGALSSLVQAVSYAGTDAVLPIPAIKLPALGANGVELELMPARTYDFAEAFAMAPSQILLLVRSLATAALVWFAVKEVVGFIQYFLTLRGGETSE